MTGPSSSATILCVDDEPAVAALLERVLTEAGYRVMLAGSGKEALEVIDRSPVDLILADYNMPQMTGLELLRQLEERSHRIPVVIVTGYATVEDAVLCIRSGAVDYITKPVRSDTLAITVLHALEFARLRRENEAFRTELSRIRSRRALVGNSQPMRRLYETVATVAPTWATVLLEGESGTGKELFARAIHEQSPRRDAPFITVNCAALPEGLVESVLFGHEKGAFTGATTRASGAFERAHRGTLLLDEVSEMRLDLQAKLLRVIQEQEFERVGGRESIKVDVRLVATTNRDLKAEVDAGRFRADLYYRLNVMPIRTPPLREREGDIALLAHYFVKVAAERLGVESPSMTPEAIDVLQQHDWPGNVRELSNVIERAVILSRGAAIDADALRPHVSRPASASAVPAPAELPLDLASLEQIAIERALAATSGNRTRAAQLLGISERTLRTKLNPPRSA
ncbi:MAG TPA: sigma-54 dependent transcriptional regulator [Gemmatimonadales bacterium]